MTESGEILCFECGRPVEDPPAINHHTDGEPCEACADRLLLESPSLLPSEVAEEEERLVAGGEGDPRPEEAEMGNVLPFPTDDEPA